MRYYHGFEEKLKWYRFKKAPFFTMIPRKDGIYLVNTGQVEGQGMKGFAILTLFNPIGWIGALIGIAHKKYLKDKNG